MKSLYPSLKREDTVIIVGQLVEESDIDYDDLDFKELGKYLAVNLSPEEIVGSNLIAAIPNRRL